MTVTKPFRTFVVGILLGSVALVAPASASPPSTADAVSDGPGTAPARAAIERLAPRLADRFVLRLEPTESDSFGISSYQGHILLEGSDNGALVSAFARYLEDEAGGQIARGPDHIPAAAPLPDSELEVTSPYEHRYFNNFTVGGYTSPSWGWGQWQRELDLLAAHGANMALVTIGQEIVWLDTFQDFGYTAEEVRDWIMPISHQPWQWMGNIEDTDSGLTPELIQRRAELGRKIIDRMRELGITPVVPGYGGMVPPGFAERNPGAHIVPQGDWHDYRRPDWLDTTTPLYAEVAASYYAHQRQRFGPLHAQAIDLLHEGGASGDVPLAEAAQGIDRALAAADPDYLWVIQAWQDNPRQEIVEAVDTDHLLVLDLTHGQWRPTNGFHGASWAWGELGNFGGRLGLFGHLDDIATDLPAALASPESGDLRGIAFMHEGLEQDPIVEQLWSRMSWQAEPVALEAWTRDYVESRYGVADPDAVAAWRTLVDVAYQVSDARRADSVLNAQPDIGATGAANRNPRRLPYDPATIEDALGDLLLASPRLGHLATYQHDLVDVARQVIVNRGRVVLPEVKAAYEAGDLAAFRRTSQDFLDLLRLEEGVLSTREEFLFGPWVADARSWGTTSAERAKLVDGAKRLLTIWAETRAGHDNLREYANRDWAGLVGGYYLPRWRLYFQTLHEALVSGSEPEPVDWFAYGNEFAGDHGARFATDPFGDPVGRAIGAAEHLLALDIEPVQLFRAEPTAVEVTVRNVRPDTVLSGAVRLDLPDGWAAEPAQSQVRVAPGESQTVAFEVTAPAAAAYGVHDVAAILDRPGADLRTHRLLQVVRRSIAQGQPAEQSSTAFDGTPDRAVDGNTDGTFSNASVTHTGTQADPWWQVDLGAAHDIDEIVLWNRTDCCGERLRDVYVLTSEEPFTSDSLSETLGQPGVWSWHRVEPVGTQVTVPVDDAARYVRVQLDGDSTLLSLAEVKVVAAEN